MLPKNRRISRKEFRYIVKNGKRFNSPNLLLHALKIDDKQKSKESRFSFSVSKKVCRRAVDRNKNRRRGYCIVAENLKNIKLGFWCLFSLKKTSIIPQYRALEKEIKELLSLSGVLI